MVDVRKSQSTTRPQVTNRPFQSKPTETMTQVRREFGLLRNSPSVKSLSIKPENKNQDDSLEQMIETLLNLIQTLLNKLSNTTEPSTTPPDEITNDGGNNDNKPNNDTVSMEDVENVVKKIGTTTNEQTIFTQDQVQQFLKTAKPNSKETQIATLLDSLLEDHGRVMIAQTQTIGSQSFRSVQLSLSDLKDMAFNDGDSKTLSKQDQVFEDILFPKHHPTEPNALTQDQRDRLESIVKLYNGSNDSQFGRLFFGDNMTLPGDGRSALQVSRLVKSFVQDGNEDAGKQLMTLFKASDVNILYEILARNITLNFSHERDQNKINGAQNPGSLMLFS